MSILDSGSNAAFTAVFVQTNEQGTNRVSAFRSGDGTLEPPGEYRTGAGLGAAHLTHDADAYQRVGVDAVPAWTGTQVTRPARDLARSTALYRDLLGLSSPGGFEDHDGDDGVFFTLPGGGELELTAGPVEPGAGTDDDLQVLQYRHDRGGSSDRSWPRLRRRPNRGVTPPVLESFRQTFRGW